MLADASRFAALSDGARRVAWSGSLHRHIERFAGPMEHHRARFVSRIGGSVE